MNPTVKPETSAKTLVLADDHRMFLEGLERLLEIQTEFEVVGTAGDGEELVDLALDRRPDLIVTDLTMPGLSGLQAIHRVRDAGIDARAIILTMHVDPEFASKAIDSGVNGYVLKQAASTELVAAIEESLRGGRWVSPTLALSMLETERAPAPKDEGPVHGLTARQREVLELLVQGKIAKEIAAALNISRKTVEYHKYRMMGELGVSNSAELIRVGIEGGLGG
ncbi:MAG: response regulator transcription factor [Planctomycetota bacterium]